MKKRYLAQWISMLGMGALSSVAWAQEAPAAAPVAAVQAAPAAAPATGPIQSVPQAVEKAVMNHPELRARFHDFTSALEGQNVARGGWKPQITAQGWVGREWRNNRSGGAASSDWHRPGWSLDLRQLIFDGGATTNNIRQLGFEKLSAYYELKASSDVLANEVVAAYLDVQRYREMQRLAQENFTMHQNTMKQLRERSESGVGRGVDLEQASGRLSLAQTNLMTESNNLNDVSQRYRRLVGEQPAADLAPAPDVAQQLPVAGVVTDFGAELRTHPSLLSKQALVQAAEAGQNSARALHAPTLDLRASTGRDREEQYSDRQMQSSRVQLMLTYPLYRGGSDEARIRQTVAQTYAAQDVRDYTCRNVQQELSVAWNNIQRLKQQLPFLQEHEMSTSKVRVAYQQQFQIGQRSLLDLLDTENELFDARRALLNAQYDLKKMEFQWLTLSNKVLPALSLAPVHADSQPEEHGELAMPDDILMACQTPVPDTSNLVPVVAVQ